MSSKAEKRAKFDHVFNVIRDELVDYIKAQNVPTDAVEWYTRVSPVAVAAICFRMFAHSLLLPVAIRTSNTTSQEANLTAGSR